MHASCVNGRLRASGLSGRAELSTVNGNARGSISTDWSSPVEVSSVNAKVLPSPASDAKVEIEASTVSGFDLQRTSVSGSPITSGFGHELNGELGGGGTRVRVNNVNGRIEIQPRQRQQAAESGEEHGSRSGRRRYNLKSRNPRFSTPGISWRRRPEIVATTPSATASARCRFDALRSSRLRKDFVHVVYPASDVSSRNLQVLRRSRTCCFSNNSTYSAAERTCTGTFNLSTHCSEYSLSR